VKPQYSHRASTLVLPTVSSPYTKSVRPTHDEGDEGDEAKPLASRDGLAGNPSAADPVKSVGPGQIESLGRPPALVSSTCHEKRSRRRCGIDALGTALNVRMPDDRSTTPAQRKVGATAPMGEVMKKIGSHPRY